MPTPRLSFLVVLLIVPGASMAAPKALLTYRGKPVHPFCVSQLLDATQPVDLKNCRPGKGTLKPNKGGLEFIPAPNEDSDGREVYRYSVLSRTGNRAIVRYFFNGGGTGYFSGILVVDLSGATLSMVEHLAGGDRCNQGLKDAEYHAKTQAIDYSVMATSTDLIEALGAVFGVVAHDGLVSSANACVGLIRYRYQNGTNTLVGVSFDPPGTEPDSSPPQACFEGLVLASIKKGKSSLDAAEADAFRKEFQARCKK